MTEKFQSEVNYKSRYKKEFHISKIKDYIFTNILLFLLKFKWFLNLKSIRDTFWAYSLTDKSSKLPDTVENSIESSKVKPISTVYFALSEINYIDNFFTTLLKYLKKSETDINSLLKKVDDIKGGFKSQSIGHFCKFKIEEVASSKIDYIDNVEIYYSKTTDSLISFFIKVNLSSIFISYFNNIIESTYKIKKVINFFPILKIIKRKKFIKDFSYQTGQKFKNINKLFYDLNWQVKNYLLKDFNYIFSNDKNSVLPHLIFYSFDKEYYSQKKFEITESLNCSIYGEFKNEKENIYFYLDDSASTSNIYKYKDNSSKLFVDLLDYDKNASDDQKHFNVFEGYIYSLSQSLLIWHLRKPFYSESYNIQLNIFKYFLKRFSYKSIKKTKGKLYQQYLIVKRLKREVSSNKLNFNFNIYPNDDLLCDISPGMPNSPKDNLKNILLTNVDYFIDTNEQDYEFYNNIFEKIAQDKLIKVNLNIQYILILLGIIAIIFSFYGANSVWVNKYLQYFMKLWFGIDIPQ